jgi:hypothetical protein
MLDAGGEVQSINQGSDLAIALIETHRTLKAWRLLKRLIAICKQHHGQKHWFMIELEKILHNNCKKHLVSDNSIFNTGITYMTTLHALICLFCK